MRHDALGRVKICLTEERLEKARSEIREVITELEKWRKFDKLMLKEIDRSGLINLKEYNLAKARLGL